MAAFAARRINPARHSKNLPPIFGGEIGSDERATCKIRFHDYRAQRHSGDNTIPNGKALLVRGPKERELSDEGARCRNPLEKLDVLRRKHQINARPENG